MTHKKGTGVIINMVGVLLLLLISVSTAAAAAPYWQRSAASPTISYRVSDLADGTAILHLALHDEAPLLSLFDTPSQDVRWLQSGAVPLGLCPPEGRGVTHQLIELSGSVHLLFLLYEDGGLIVRLPPWVSATADLLAAARLRLDRVSLFEMHYVPRAATANEYRQLAATVALAPAQPFADRLVLPPPARLDSPRNGGVIARINERASLLLLQPQAFVFAAGHGNATSLDFEGTTQNTIGRYGECGDDPCVRVAWATGYMSMIANNGIRVFVVLNIHSREWRDGCTTFTTYRLSVVGRYGWGGSLFGGDDYVNTWEEPVAVPLRASYHREECPVWRRQ